MKGCLQDRRAGRRRGSALIGVFWLLAVLSLAVFTTAQLVHNDMAIVVSQKLSFRAGQLAEMGISIGMNPVVEKYDPLLYQELGSDEAFEVHLVSEGGRLSINALLVGDRVLLEELFMFWGLEQSDAEELVDALQDWIDPDDLPALNGAEYEYYADLGFENYPFDRPFYNIEEMALVRGMDLLSEYKPNWRDYFTLWSSGQLNVNEADAELLEVVAKVSLNSAEEFVELRNGYDFLPDTEDDIVFETIGEAAAILGIPEGDEQTLGRLSVSDPTLRIESTGYVGEYLKTVVLVVRNRESNPIILAREEIFYR